MVVCGALLVSGVVAAVRWGGRPFEAPARPEPGTVLGAGEVARRYVWYVALTLLAGVAAGVTVVGGGGRLAMRLLAVTAGDAAQGRITEAEEVVGEVTVGGTIGFVLFNGIFVGVTTAAVYLLVRRLLPPGRLGGLTYGLGLLVVLGVSADPLRRDNPDFDIVGPGWLSVAVFTAIALLYGATLAATAARLSGWLPLPAAQRRVVARYLPPAALAAVLFVVTAMAALVGAAVVLLSRWGPAGAAVRSPRWVVVGRVLAVVLVLASLPATLAGVADIATR
jgi:hypothetical protein